jgi:cytochrome c
VGRFIIALVILAYLAGRGMAEEPDARIERGKATARSLCAQCHAIGSRDQSPHPGAPAFRSLERRLDVDALTDRLRQGLTSGHRDMPTFRFTREDARALVAYLRSIQRR